MTNQSVGARVLAPFKAITSVVSFSEIALSLTGRGGSMSDRLGRAVDRASKTSRV